MALRQPVTTELTPYQACTAGQQYVHELILARSFIGSTGLFLYEDLLSVVDLT
jgi:hypothetical protein